MQGFRRSAAPEDIQGHAMQGFWRSHGRTTVRTGGQTWAIGEFVGIHLELHAPGRYERSEGRKELPHTRCQEPLIKRC
jgi:hypothetical protein